MKYRYLGLLAMLLAHGARADMQEIVVTAQKRSGGFDEMPAVTISKPADFLVQQIRLINDSRAPDLRKKELSRISEENARLSKAMGEKCQVKIDGLEGRVRWERSEVAELTLYIPYRVEISNCVYQP